LFIDIVVPQISLLGVLRIVKVRSWDFVLGVDWAVLSRYLLKIGDLLTEILGLSRFTFGVNVKCRLRFGFVEKV
jgi:hypothetical protein